MLHNICTSAVAMSLRCANRGPWASCLLEVGFVLKIDCFSEGDWYKENQSTDSTGGSIVSECSRHGKWS